MKLSTCRLEYDVETRWNSIFDMLEAGLKAQAQIKEFLKHQRDLPQFTGDDWHRLSQIHRILSRFKQLTDYVSSKKPQISMAIPHYYDLHDLLHQGAAREGSFGDLDNDIVAAIDQGLQKYRKYYAYMDQTDAYYTALLLDPRVKGDLLRRELDEEAAEKVIDDIRQSIYKEYSKPTEIEASDPSLSGVESYDTPEARMMQRLAPVARKPAGSDIDDYFTAPRTPFEAAQTTCSDWLLKWWNTHRDEMPQMAAVARDYLAIPAAEVGVERLFSQGRDLLGLRRGRMNSKTIRMMMLMGDHNLRVRSDEDEEDEDEEE